jgi:hypothetical protein
MLGAQGHGPQPSIAGGVPSNLLQNPPVCALAGTTAMPVASTRLINNNNPTMALRGMACSMNEALGWPVFMV